jgi:antitoxin HigA-1
MTEKKLPPLHPGEVLREDFLLPLGLSEYRLAQEIGVHPRRINAIVHGIRGVTPDTALRLEKFFGVSAQFWMNLQVMYDLEVGAVKLSMPLKKIKVYEPATQK